MHSNRRLDNVDSICKEDLKNERRNYILSFIEKKGVMPELFNKERPIYAPAFYHCSCSFVKYLVEEKGIEVLLNSYTVFGREHEELEKLINLSLDSMKSSWILSMENK